MTQHKNPSKFKEGPQLVWSVLCKESAIDQQSNSVSLFHALERITLDKKQVESFRARGNEGDILLPLECELVSLWMRGNASEPLTTSAVFTIIDPQDNELHHDEIVLQFEKGKKRLRHRFQMNGVKVRDEGTYWFQISLGRNKTDSKEVANVPLEVVFKENPQ